LLNYRRIRSRIGIRNGMSYYWIQIRIQEAQKHTDPILGIRIRNTAYL
jgi:hypothetical protein